MLKQLQLHEFIPLGCYHFEPIYVKFDRKYARSSSLFSKLVDKGFTFNFAFFFGFFNMPFQFTVLEYYFLYFWLCVSRRKKNYYYIKSYNLLKFRNKTHNNAEKKLYLRTSKILLHLVIIQQKYHHAYAFTISYIDMIKIKFIHKFVYVADVIKFK